MCEACRASWGREKDFALPALRVSGYQAKHPSGKNVQVQDGRWREVDVLVTREQKPWFLAEVKKGDSNVSHSLDDIQTRKHTC
jgi:hypothetical protein